MTHKELKEAGWKEWLAMNDLTGVKKHQIDIIRGAYDYGWYNAYELKSDDTRHKEMMKVLRSFKDKLD